MRRVRHSRVIALALAVTSLTAVPALFPATASDEPWVGRPSLIGGVGRYDAGEWIYNDFVYDDYGADTAPGGQPNVVSLAPTSGDMRYPDGDDYRDNAADISEVRVRAVGDDLQVRVELQTLVNPATTALWVNVNDAERVVSASDANAAIDTAANTITFSIPGAAALPTVRLNIGAGLHDGNGALRAGQAGSAYLNSGAITTGGSTSNRLFDLAFNSRALEPRGGAWNEDAQSVALAGAQRFTLLPFAQAIDTGLLKSAAVTPVPSDPGYYVRLFESRQDIREGVAGSFPQYGGRLQPYALWIPDGYDAAKPNPLVLNMHSLSVHHNQYRGGAASPPSYTSFYEQVGDRLDALVITPLGRGPDGWYLDEGLIDTMEVWSDTVGKFSVDADRTVVTGYSMGGYGTYRLSTIMPDSFASAVSVVGPPGNGIWAYPGSPPGGADSPDFTYTQLEATRHIPFWITHGVADELVPVLGVRQQAARFGELGHEYRFALHPAEDHLSFAFKDDWGREAAWFESHLTRVENPHDVMLRVRPASWLPDSGPELHALFADLVDEVGAQPDGGYWVSDVVTSGGGDVTGVIDLTSGGIARQRAGGTAVGPAPGVDGPSPYVLTGYDVAYADFETADVLSGTLGGVSSLTIDVGRAGLSDDPVLDITADGPVTITFVRDGQPVRVTTL
jgi:dienelactone hydrolase